MFCRYQLCFVDRAITYYGHGGTRALHVALHGAIEYHEGLDGKCKPTLIPLFKAVDGGNHELYYIVHSTNTHRTPQTPIHATHCMLHDMPTAIDYAY